MTNNYILPLSAKVSIEVIDYLFDNHNQYVGFAIKPGFLANHTAYQVSKEQGIEVNPEDVIKTWEQMLADGQLTEAGYYSPDRLYSVNKEMV